MIFFFKKMALYFSILKTMKKLTQSLSNVGCLRQEGWAKRKRGSGRRKRKMLQEAHEG